MRRLLAGVLGTLAVAAGVPLASPAAAAPITTCTPTRGAIVAVDFGHWGGPIVRGCGLKSATGYDLLNDGGFSTAGDQHDGPAFICRLGNAAFHGGAQYPTPAQDACVVTPPASAYWSYWLAPRGQNTWSYSQLGAMSNVPKPGEVELWSFGGTNIAGTKGVPTVSPESLRAKSAAGTGLSPTRSSPRPAPRTSHAASSSSPNGGRPAPHTSSTSTAPRAPSSSAAGSSPSSRPRTPRSTATTGSGPQSPTTAASSPAIIDASPAAATADTPKGSSTPVIVGVLLALIIGGGTASTVIRRRRTDG